MGCSYSSDQTSWALLILSIEQGSRGAFLLIGSSDLLSLLVGVLAELFGFGVQGLTLYCLMACGGSCFFHMCDLTEYL